jgi:PPOX class probable F420-dependent enzyme
MSPEPVLSEGQRAFLTSARRAVLATIARDGRARLVPICFVLDRASPVIHTPIDDKPKRGDDPLELARVRDIAADPRVTILADRWHEDWDELAWLRGDGRAVLVPADETDERHAAIVALRAKYPQYQSHHLEDRPLIRIALERVIDWGPLG